MPGARRGGGGKVLPYISYIGMCAHRVGFLRRFVLKTSIHFAHFGLELGAVFEGTTECMNVFIVQFQTSKKERKRIMRIRNGFE